MTLTANSSSLAVVGRSIPRRDGPAKATAEAKYLDDLVLPDLMYGRMLYSPYPHARIRRIETSRAEALDGVVAVVTAADAPDVLSGRRLKDRALFAREKVRYVGDPVAAVAAVDRQTAARALELIEVECEELPAVLDLEEAIRPGAPLVHEHVETYAGYKPGEPMAGYSKNVAAFTRVTRGDVEKGLAESSLVVEGRYRTHRQAVAPMETRGGIARFDPLTGRYTVWSTTAAPFRIRASIAELLGVPVARVQVIPSTCGGSFGGKSDGEPEVVAALLSRKAGGRPVKIVWMRGEELQTTMSRHPALVEIKTGVARDGRLLARDVRVFFEAGARANMAVLITACATLMAAGPYRIPNVRSTGYAVYTNQIPGGAFRGFGEPQTSFAFETQMDEIAERLGIDPLDIRLMNAAEEGEKMLMGHVMQDVTLKECLLAAAEGIAWRERKAHKVYGRGVGIASGEALYGGHPSGAVVKMNEDGSVTLQVGAVDIGQGSNTILCQIAAEELGVRPDDIMLVPIDTDTSPFDIGTFASRVTFHTGNAVQMAAAQVKEQLLTIAADLLEADAADLVARQGQISVRGAPDRAIAIAQVARHAHFTRSTALIGHGSHGPGDIDKDWAIEGTSYGGLVTNAFSAQAAEVEVDVETGEVTVLQVSAANDCGRAINPQLLEGQMQGGAATGIGFALLEELQTRDGRVINGEFKEYLVPTALDMPRLTCRIIETGHPTGPYGAKGAADGCVNPTTAAIANAVYDAVGVWVRELPLTPEKVLAALEGHFSTRR